MASDPKPKVWKGWCVYGFRGHPWTWTAAWRRREALRKVEREMSEPWRKLRRRGFTVRRVSLSPLESERNG